MSKPDYDTTLARIAGNIAGPLAAENARGQWKLSSAQVAAEAIELARLIVAGLRPTEFVLPAEPTKEPR